MSTVLNKNFRLSIKKILKPFLISSSVLIILGIVAEVLRELDLLGSKRSSARWFYNLFDLDGEWNIPALYSTIAILFCAILLAFITEYKKDNKDRYAKKWHFLSLIFCYLAADELLSIHEIFISPQLQEFLLLPDRFDNIWVIPFSSLLILFLYKYQNFIKHLPSQIKIIFLTAGSIYVAGAIGIEFLADMDIWEKVVGGYHIVVEESLEIIGILVFIYGLLKYLQQLDVQFQMGFILEEK